MKHISLGKDAPCTRPIERLGDIVAHVRRGMIQLAWRFLMFQKGSALAQWYRARTVDARQGTRKSLIVAMARKLLIELWRFVTTGQTPVGVEMRPV